MHGSFGKRGLTPAAAPSPDEGTTAVDFWRSPLAHQLRGVMIGVGLAFMGIAVYVSVMKGFGRALDRSWSNVHTCVPAPTYSRPSNPDEESSGAIEFDMHGPAPPPQRDC